VSRVLRAQLPQDGRSFRAVLPLAHRPAGPPLNFTAALHVQFAERGDQRDGEIVNAVEPRSSNVLRTVLFPEPLSPVRITSCRASRADRRFTGLAMPLPGAGVCLECGDLRGILQRFFV